jgi:hypothetical protein
VLVNLRSLKSQTVLLLVKAIREVSLSIINQVVWQRDFKLYCPLQIVGTANKRSQNDYGGLHCCY